MTKKTVRTIAILLFVAMLPISMGCVSKMVFEESKKQVALKKATIKNDQNAIKTIRLGEDSVGIGIDVTNWEALKERPWTQLGAALVDAAIIYGAKEAVAGLNDSSSTGDGNVSVNVNSGRDTSVNVSTDGDDTTNTTNTDNSDRSNRSENN